MPIAVTTGWHWLCGLQSKQVAMEELTAGQASTLVRNEQEIEKFMDEMEDLEETLCDSIR